MRFVMSKIIRYTNSGHRFEIDGLIETGYTIEVTIIPADGYEFVQWLTGLPNITEIESDYEGHRRFSIYIDECGFSFSALFQPYTAPECDLSAIYLELLNIICSGDHYSDLPYDTNENISCGMIDSMLSSILC